MQQNFGNHNHNEQHISYEQSMAYYDQSKMEIHTEGEERVRLWKFDMRSLHGLAKLLFFIFYQCARVVAIGSFGVFAVGTLLASLLQKFAALYLALFSMMVVVALFNGTNFPWWEVFIGIVIFGGLYIGCEHVKELYGSFISGLNQILNYVYQKMQ